MSIYDVSGVCAGASHLLAVQIDAAINPGNSGGPVLQNGKVVGIAFQAVLNAENIGFIIPSPVVKHFLTDYERFGKYVGFCTLGVRCQGLDNWQLRNYLRMESGQTGIMVNTVFPMGSAHGVLCKGDVLLAFDGIPISNDGSVPFRGCTFLCSQSLKCFVLYRSCVSLCGGSLQP